VPSWFSESEFQLLSTACARLIPSSEGVRDGGEIAGDGGEPYREAGDRHSPGALEAGVPDYIDGFLGAFSFDPPRIWAGGPYSGRNGGEAGFGSFVELTRIDEIAWRTRIEGSRGVAEREFNGPVVGLQERYRIGLEALGSDFCEISGGEQDERLRAQPEFTALLYEHCCEGMYGAPEYGGNRDQIAWRSIRFPGDVQPRGYTDAEVSQP